MHLFSYAFIQLFSYGVIQLLSYSILYMYVYISTLINSRWPGRYMMKAKFMSCGCEALNWGFWEYLPASKLRILFKSDK